MTFSYQSCGGCFPKILRVRNSEYLRLTEEILIKSKHVVNIAMAPLSSFNGDIFRTKLTTRTTQDVFIEGYKNVTKGYIPRVIEPSYYDLTLEDPSNPFVYLDNMGMLNKEPNNEWDLFYQSYATKYSDDKVEFSRKNNFDKKKPDDWYMFNIVNGSIYTSIVNISVSFILLPR